MVLDIFGVVHGIETVNFLKTNVDSGTVFHETKIGWDILFNLPGGLRFLYDSVRHDLFIIHIPSVGFAYGK